MMKIYIESRDEIRIIDMQEVCFLQASHNYTDFVFADGRTKSELVGISVLEGRIAEAARKAGIPNPFVRVGRSLLVNTSHIELVSIKLKLISFRGNPPITLSASKNMLMLLKRHLSESMQ
jgi:DNA-binding LytR/AlgR family response regulator